MILKTSRQLLGGKKICNYINEIVFHGKKELPPDLMELNTPYDCFCYFLNDELFLQLAEQSNRYAFQKNINTKFKVDFLELQKFVGILIFMSVYHYPNVRSYWGKHSFDAIC